MIFIFLPAGMLMFSTNAPSETVIVPALPIESTAAWIVAKHPPVPPVFTQTAAGFFACALPSGTATRQTASIGMSAIDRELLPLKIYLPGSRRPAFAQGTADFYVRAALRSKRSRWDASAQWI